MRSHRNKSILLAVICGTLCAAEPEKIPEKDLELTRFFHMLYETTPPDAAERLYVNLSVSPRSFILRKTLQRRYQVGEKELDTARKELEKIRAEILRGRQWPLKKREQFSVPYRGKTPLVFEDAFPLNSLKKVPSQARWELSWDEKYLYVDVRVLDKDIKIYGYESTCGEFAWEADCIEIFIMPDPELKVYCEIVVNPAGEVFAAYHCNDTRGWFVYALKMGIKGLKSQTTLLKEGGYHVQTAIPLAELPDFQFGNSPEGQMLYMQLLHINNAEKRTVRPLLYDPHNIFGYFQLKLTNGPNDQ